MTDAPRPSYAPPSEQYEAEARAWDEAGRPRLDPGMWHTATMYLWVHSRGAARQGVSARVTDYLAALRGALDAAYPGWYDGLFDERSSCAHCGERYRWENLAVCTACGAELCYQHRGAGGAAPNGNDLCVRCGVGEVVG